MRWCYHLRQKSQSIGIWVSILLRSQLRLSTTMTKRTLTGMLTSSSRLTLSDRIGSMMNTRLSTCQGTRSKWPKTWLTMWRVMMRLETTRSVISLRKNSKRSPCSTLCAKILSISTTCATIWVNLLKRWVWTRSMVYSRCRTVLTISSSSTGWICLISEEPSLRKLASQSWILRVAPGAWASVRTPLHLPM